MSILLLLVVDISLAWSMVFGLCWHAVRVTVVFLDTLSLLCTSINNNCIKPQTE
jgi:hypothetical protein